MISSVKDIHLDSTVFSCSTCNKTDWLSSMNIVFIITCFWPHFCPVALMVLYYVETNVTALLLWLKQYRQMKWLCYIHHHHRYHMYEELLIWKEHRWQKSGCVYTHTHTHTHIYCCCCLVAKLCLFATPWLQHARLPCPLLSPGVCSNSWYLDFHWLYIYMCIYMYFYIFTLYI